MSQTTSRVSELIVTLSLFEIGSTTLFMLGGEAKQDAWLAMLIGAIVGLFLLLLHLSIHRQDPSLDLFLLFRRYLGKYLGTIMNLLFVGYFTYETSRNLRDLGEVTVMTLLNQTSLWIIMLVTIIVISNTVRYGPEIFFFVCMIIFPVIVITYVVISILIPATGLLHIEFFQPILEKGLKPVLKAAIPDIVSFPFGQTVLFLVFYPLATKGRNLSRAVIISYSLTALFLTAFNQLNILVLGPKLAANITLPFLTTVQLIQLPEVLERMDAFFTLVLFLGLGVKMAAFFNGATIGMERITGISSKKWVLPLAALIYGLAFISPNYIHHIEIGRGVVVKYWWPVFQFVLPLLLYIVMLIRRKKKAS
ncbi:GerAB/ArcD/ProY family transporter [Paenibacillus crassostreae]|uniref:Spore gernimation protein n=1 Tax=Paenibacillus crassostreae TaxID=1763538 RepID=A0A167BIG4_9BACL|nr:endospore germination permease [Paenibacillus crassostreae]AOZ94692.1 spore gernimation protein [Paenibacillus crassostreae]OAB72096.1 spore gernimation protein [Paenibacillus crassostreae]